MNEMELIYDANALYGAFQKAKKGVSWKESVQRYEMNLLRNINKTQKELIDGSYEELPFHEFILSERGKTRPIKASSINDRVVFGSTCDNVLIPKLEKYLIYDNGASMKDKGIHFARKRMCTQLHRYYREHGSNEGYILQVDYSKFFDNIAHEELIKAVRAKISDEEFMTFFQKLIDAFRVDVSYMSDDEYADCIHILHDTLKHAQIDKSKLTGEKYMGKSVGIGSPVSQISGVFYPSRIDNYCKIVEGQRDYGRYMDDIHCINSDKEYLKELLKKIERMSYDLGLFVNPKKTQIVKLSHGFTYLKIKYTLTETGKVIQRINHDSVVRMRRKLKRYRRLMDEGKMTFDDVRQSYDSWKGDVMHYDSYRTVKSMDEYFNKLFIEPFGGQGI